MGFRHIKPCLLVSSGWQDLKEICCILLLRHLNVLFCLHMNHLTSLPNLTTFFSLCSVGKWCIQQLGESGRISTLRTFI